MIGYCIHGRQYGMKSAWGHRWDLPTCQCPITLCRCYYNEYKSSNRNAKKKKKWLLGFCSALQLKC